MLLVCSADNRIDAEGDFRFAANEVAIGIAANARVSGCHGDNPGCPRPSSPDRRPFISACAIYRRDGRGWESLAVRGQIHVATNTSEMRGFTLVAV
jgi:hypothetical protein